MSPSQVDTILTPITRENIDELLDQGKIAVAIIPHGANTHWWRIRRNGRTRTWKRDPERICIPYKAGMYVYGRIEKGDFVDGRLLPHRYRVIP